MSVDYKLKKVNEFKYKGFDISLAKHPDDNSKLFIVAVKGGHVVRLFAEPTNTAIEYIRKIREQ